MFQALLHRVSLLRIEYQHFAKEIQGYRIGLWVQGSPALFVALWKFANILPGQIVADKSHIFMCGCSQNRNRSFDLVQVIVSREQRSSTKQLSENAADAPHIQSVGVVASIQNNFWSSIPSCNHILRQSSRRLFIASGQPEVANFEVAVLIQQQVARFQVSMNNIGAVDVETTS